MIDEYFVVKIGDEGLYFNDTSELGEHLSSTPALLSNREANLVIRYFNKLNDPDSDSDLSFGPEDLEIIKVKITILK